MGGTLSIRSPPDTHRNNRLGRRSRKISKRNENLFTILACGLFGILLISFDRFDISILPKTFQDQASFGKSP